MLSCSISRRIAPKIRRRAISCCGVNGGAFSAARWTDASVVSLCACAHSVAGGGQPIERHHLFPKGYLKSVLGISDTKRVNQIANFALVDWVENIAISRPRPMDEYLSASFLPISMPAHTELAWYPVRLRDRPHRSPGR